MQPPDRTTPREVGGREVGGSNESGIVLYSLVHDNIAKQQLGTLTSKNIKQHNKTKCVQSSMNYHAFTSIPYTILVSYVRVEYSTLQSK
jgi:hypothetical protein